MPSDFSYANSCVNVFLYSDVLYVYIFALKLLIEMLINKLYICKFEQ